jgi:hypothetical protein
LMACIRRRRSCGLPFWNLDAYSSSSDVARIVTAVAHETLHGVLLTTTDGLPNTADLSSSTIAMCPTRVSANPMTWEHSDD